MKTFCALSALVFMALSFSPARSDDPRQEAVDLVNKAIDYYKSDGKEKAFAEISNPKGMFTRHNGELYIFVYDMNGTCVAHGQNPQEIGLNKLLSKDRNGLYYVKARVELAKTKGEGWEDYMFKEPHTGKSLPKMSYIKRVDDYIFGCGIYK